MDEGARATRPPGWAKHAPNLLCYLRIVAAAALPFVPPAWRLPIVVFAGASDWLDGAIARRYRTTSRLGSLLDGIADKAFVLAAVLTFVRSGDIELWQGLLVMTRDLTVGLISAYCVLRKAWHAFGHMQVRLAGKLTTALAIPWFATLLVPVLEPGRAPFFFGAAAASLFAGGDYFAQFLRKVDALRP